MKGGLDEVYRLKKVHSRWMRIQYGLGAIPAFCIVNRFSPMLTDGYGEDLLPTLLPEPIQAHYNLLVLIGLAAFAISEIFRRRYHNRHKEDLALL